MIETLRRMLLGRRHIALEEELVSAREDMYREREKQVALAKETTKAIVRMKRDTRPDTVLREIANLQRFLREELDA